MSQQSNGHAGPGRGAKDAGDVAEQVKKDLEERFLTPSNRLPAHWLADWQKYVWLGVIMDKLGANQCFVLIDNGQFL